MLNDEEIMNLKYSNVIVTGGCGFIGGHLVNTLLSQGVNVKIIDDFSYALPENVKKFKELGIVHEADICNINPDLEVLEDTDCLFHFAAINIPGVCEKEPLRSWQVNVLGTFAVALAAFANKVKKLIFTSSAYVYSQPPVYLPMDEKHPTSKTQSFYGLMKLISESACWDQRMKYSATNVGIARLFNIYGPGQTDNYVIPRIIKQCIEKSSDTVELWEGDSTRDFLFIQDVIDGLIRLANFEGSLGPINFGTGKQISIDSLVKTVFEINGKKNLVYTNDKIPKTFLMSNSMLSKETLGWEAKVSMRDGLEYILKELNKGI